MVWRKITLKTTLIIQIFSVTLQPKIKIIYNVNGRIAIISALFVGRAYG